MAGSLIALAKATDLARCLTRTGEGMELMQLKLWVVGIMLLLPFLAGCSLLKAAPTSTPTSIPPSTGTPTSCDGWWCTVRGVVYVGEIVPGNELDNAVVKLGQFSYCSPTKGETQTITGPDGAFEFSDLFFHDTDRVWIEVGSDGAGPRQWDSKGQYCYFCTCFGEPIEIVLPEIP